MNIQKIMQQAQKLKAQLEEAKVRIRASEHEGVAAGGLVSIRMTGAYEVLGIHISPELLKENADIVEDTMAIALKDVCQKIDAFTKEHTPAMPGAF